MTETQVIGNKKQAIDISQDWIDSNGLNDVCKAKNFVMKIPVNKIYQMEAAYLFLIPTSTIFIELSDKADELNVTKLSKIKDLEDQAAALRASITSISPDKSFDPKGDRPNPNLNLNDYSRPPHPPIGQPLVKEHNFV